MTTAYTATSNIESVKLKAWTSTSSSLTDAQLLSLLEDSLRSYVVPFVKRARDEWFVKGGATLQPNSNGRITIPNSVGSTVRTVSWNNNGTLIPLPRIEPENALPMLSSGGATPVGFVLKGYELQIVPAGVGSVSIFIEFMERPAPMVLESDAGNVVSVAGGTFLTLADMPLAWQEETPDAVDIISGESPFSVLYESVPVQQVLGDVLRLQSNPGDIPAGSWASDVGATPFPNIPIELHPLLQQDVICTLFTGLGDKRLQGAVAKQEKLEKDLLATIIPRTQGNSRPITNRSGPGWNTGWWGRGV